MTRHPKGCRRQCKNRDDQKYKTTDKKIKQKIRQAKDKLLKEECDEIKEYQRKYDSLNQHKKIKEITDIMETSTPYRRKLVTN